ncbi:MAG: hypothetical protein R3253_02290, partial [Longimicrobiales bacterium]|nr:hypothetical protein [Longimicrobiales bacterium]
SLEASQFVSGLVLANHFFPGLPGSAAGVGDSWVDTVSYRGSEGSGERSETAILRYTVVGDTLMGGRLLREIGVQGTSESEATIAVQGMQVSQTGEVEIQGHVLWDPTAGVMVERRTEARGSGTASAPIAPAPLPIQIRSVQTIRLQGM